MTDHRTGGSPLNAEVEEDGEEHLREMLRTDDEFRTVWEANRAKREFGYWVTSYQVEGSEFIDRPDRSDVTWIRMLDRPPS